MAALPFVIPPLLEFASGMLQTATHNYDKPYNYDLQELMMSLRADPNSQENHVTGSPQVLSENPYAEYHTYDDPTYSDQDGQGPSAQETGYDEHYEHQQSEPYQDNADDGMEPSAGQQYQQYNDNSGDSIPDSYRVESPKERPDLITLDVLLVRQKIRNGAVTLLPINDGDVLRDGRGNPQAGDKFRIMFRANTDCYVYVIAIDGSAWAQGVFPPPGNPFANPVKAGTQYVIPEQNNWFSLDQFKGIETIFFVATQQKRDDIEQIMARIGGRERSPRDTPDQVTEAPIIPQGFTGTRRSRSPFAIQTGLQEGQQLLPTTFFANTAGEALRVTRWFRHQ